jgi:hypothetical protein
MISRFRSKRGLGAVLTLSLLVPVASHAFTPVTAVNAAGHTVHALSAFIPVPVKARVLRSAQTRERSSEAAKPNLTTKIIKAGSDLQLAGSAYPIDFYFQKSQSETASDADNTAFSQVHTSSYTNLGALGGWFEYYAKPLDSGGEYDMPYQGTYYNDSDAAKNAFNDASSNLGFLGSVSGCSFGDQCAQATITITFSDGPYRGYFRAVQESNALAEFIAVVPADDFAGMQSIVLANLDTEAKVFTSIFQAPTVTTTPVTPPTTTPVTPSPPTTTPALPVTQTATVPTALNIVSVRLEKNGSTSDPGLSRSALKKAKLGKKVYLTAYISVSGAAAGTQIVDEFTVSAKQRQLWHKGSSLRVASSANAVYRDYVVYQPAKRGKESVRVNVTINGTSKEQTATFKVK